MLSLIKVRKIDPELAGLEDTELQEVVESLYDLTQLAFEKWSRERFQNVQLGR